MIHDKFSFVPNKTYRWNLRHPEKVSEYNRRYRLNHPEDTKLRNFYSNRSTKKRYNEIRKEILNSLGNKCNNCGLEDIRILQIDHVNGHGKKEIKESSSYIVYLSNVLEKIKSGSNKYQLLCPNCNWIKKIEKKE